VSGNSALVAALVMQRPRNWSLVSLGCGIGKGMSNGLLIVLGELVRLFVNVGECRFYAVSAPPIRIWSAVGNEDGLQVPSSGGAWPQVSIPLGSSVRDLEDDDRQPGRGETVQDSRKNHHGVEIKNRDAKHESQPKREAGDAGERLVLGEPSPIPPSG